MEMQSNLEINLLKLAMQIMNNTQVCYYFFFINLGYVNSNGERNGKGTYTYENEDKYEGD